MLKNIFALILLATITFTAPKTEAVNIGPFKVARPFCETIDKFSSILNVYSAVQWPVLGFPGISFGMVQNTSVLLDMCNFIMQIEQLNTQDAIFFSANYLNETTDKKWNSHLEQMDRTWNLANTVYDFDNGQFKKASLKSSQTHREINDFAKGSYTWYNKTFNKRDAELQSRGEREREMNNFSNVAYRRAILKEALSCPAGNTNSGDKDYDRIYSSEIRPKEIERDENQEDYEFFKSKLYEMGPKFSNNQDDLNKFIAGLEKLMTQGVSYEVSTKKVSEVSTKPGKKDRNGVVTQEKFTRTKDSQVFTVKRFPEQWQAFRNEQGPKWSSWVSAQFWSRGTQGIFNDPRGKIEDEFRDLNYECNARRLMRGVSTDRADYDKLQEERVEKCKNDTKMSQKNAENLMNYYIDQLQNSLYKYKNANAFIWSKESFYLGTVRSVSSKQTSDGYQQEEVVCSDKLQPAEMQKLGLKQQEVQNELNEMQAKQLLKQTTLMEEQAKAESNIVKESQRRRTFAENQQKQNKAEVQRPIGPMPINGTP